jgi:hypothetical protein
MAYPHDPMLTYRGDGCDRNDERRVNAAPGRVAASWHLAGRHTVCNGPGATRYSDPAQIRRCAALGHRAESGCRDGRFE